MTNTEKGIHSELLFSAEATARSFNVLVPLGATSSTVDVWIVPPNGRPVSVQVKRAWLHTKHDLYIIKTVRCKTSKGPNPKYREGDFDVLAAYLPDLNKFVFWQFDEIADRQNISYTPRLHRQPDNWEILDTVLK